MNPITPLWIIGGPFVALLVLAFSFRRPSAGAARREGSARMLSHWESRDQSQIWLANTDADTEAAALLAFRSIYPTRADGTHTHVHGATDRSFTLAFLAEGRQVARSGALYAVWAVVTAHRSTGLFLFDLPVKDPRVLVRPSAWGLDAILEEAGREIDGERDLAQTPASGGSCI